VLFRSLQEIEEERIRQEKIAAEMKRLQEIEKERSKQEAIAVASRLSKQAETNLKSAKSVESTKNMLSLSNITKPLTSWGGKFFQSSGSSSSIKSSEVGTAESSTIANNSAVNTSEKLVDGENNEYKVCQKAQRFREDLLKTEFAYPVVLDTSKFTDSTNKVESSDHSQCLNVDKFLISSLNSWKLWKSSVNTDPSTVEMKNFANKSVARATWSVENIPVEVMDTLDKLGLSHTGTSSVESLAINVENIGSVSFLQCFPNLKKLELNVNKLSNLHGLETLTLLTQLSAKDNVLTNLEALAGHVNITDLQLDNNHLSDASVCVLSSIPNLTNISLKANQLTRIPAMNSSKLQKLELYNNRITSLEGGQSTLCSLLYLDLGRNSIEFIDGNVLSRCQCLRTLILSQNRLTSLPANLYLPSLKVLWLGGNKISNFSAWIENNSSTVFLPLLEKLFLQDNVITCIDNLCLLACPLLVELDISFNNILSLDAFSGNFIVSLSDSCLTLSRL
jgi:Leucine-rich repeat (LRR) protein